MYWCVLYLLYWYFLIPIQGTLINIQFSDHWMGKKININRLLANDYPKENVWREINIKKWPVKDSTVLQSTAGWEKASYIAFQSIYNYLSDREQRRVDLLYDRKCLLQYAHCDPVISCLKAPYGKVVNCICLRLLTQLC